MSNNNYDAVYRNTGTTPRKMHRVEDHYPLHTFRTELDDAKDFFVGAFIVFAIIGLGVCVALGVMSWLGVAVVVAK